MTGARARAEGIPSQLQPPITLALAKGVSSIPGADELLGETRCEPRWDGFRLVCIRDDDGVQLWSRQGKNLTPIFPDLEALLL